MIKPVKTSLTTRHQAVFYFRVAMTAAALLVPLISLVLLGSLWLWQHGYILYWALGACSVTLLTYAIERWLLQVDGPDTAAGTNGAENADPAWSVREAAAWTAVVDLSHQVKPLEIESRDDVFDLGVKTIETVAHTMHPGEEHALWKFTLPEAFALVERVSSQLNNFVTENIPLGDRMTVGQFLRLYRWRSVINVAEQAYDLWRIIRLLNPAAAATQEVREQMTKRAYEWGREELARRMVQAYVREVGRAAIDLYSGRMRVAQAGETAKQAAAEAPVNADGVSRAIEPVRILFAGQVNSGKANVVSAVLKDENSSLDIVAQTSDYIAYDLKVSEEDAALLIDAPPLADDKRYVEKFLEAADQSDVVVWVASAEQVTQQGLKDLSEQARHQAAERIHRKPQPVLGVVTFKSVGSLNLGASNKAARPAVAESARLAFAEILKIPGDHVFAIGMVEDPDVRELKAHLVAIMDEARRVRDLRVKQSGKPGVSWRRLFSQVYRAGRTLASSSK